MRPDPGTGPYRSRRRCFVRGLACCGLIGLLAACESVAGAFKFIPLPLPDFTVSRTRQINIQVSPWLNEDNPVRMDVLVVYNEEMLKGLLTITAKDWFKRRDQFRLDFPAGYDVWEWELVPGQTVESLPLSDDVLRAKGAVVFAGYRTDGEHRARIDSMGNVMILLGEKGFTVESAINPS